MEKHKDESRNTKISQSEPPSKILPSTLFDFTFALVPARTKRIEQGLEEDCFYRYVYIYILIYSILFIQRDVLELKSIDNLLGNLTVIVQ